MYVITLDHFLMRINLLAYTFFGTPGITFNSVKIAPELKSYGIIVSWTLQNINSHCTVSQCQSILHFTVHSFFMSSPAIRSDELFPTIIATCIRWCPLFMNVLMSTSIIWPGKCLPAIFT